MLQRWGVGFVLVVAACAPLPKADLETYRKSFDAAQVAFGASLSELSLACADVGFALEDPKTQGQTRTVLGDLATSCGGTASAAMPVDNLLGVATTLPRTATVSGVENDITTRTLALATVASFNDALTALAEGRSQSEVDSSIAGLVGNFEKLGELLSLGTTLAIPPVFTAALGPVIKLLNDAENRAQFIAAMDAAEAPIGMILTMMEQDVADTYTMRSNIALIRARNKAAQATDVVVRMNELARSFVLAAPAAADGTKSKALLRLETIGQSATAARKAINSRSRDVVLTGNLGVPVPNAPDIIVQLEQDVEMLQALAADVATIRKQTEALLTASVSTTTLIAATRNNLRLLRAALDAPVNVQAASADFLTIVIVAKRNWDAVAAAR